MQSGVQRLTDRYCPDRRGRRAPGRRTPPWLRGSLRRIVGAEPYRVVLTNTDLDEAHGSEGANITFTDGAVGAPFSGWSLELLRAGFASADMRVVDRPVHRLLHPVAFAAGFAYEGAVNRMERLSSMRHMMIGKARA